VSLLHQSSISRLTARPGTPVALPDRAGSVYARSTARPWICVATLFATDLLALSLAATLSVLMRHHADARLDVAAYLRLWPVLLFFPFVYAASGLYPGFGRNPVDELRKLSAATSLVYPALAVTVFLLKDAASYSRGVFLLAWPLTLVLVPLLRTIARSVCSRKAWWGYPVVVVGARREARRIADTLEGQPGLGLKPVGIFEDPELAEPFARDLRVRHVIVCMAETPQRTVRDIFQYCSGLFSDVILIPDLAGFSSLWVEARDLNGVLGLEVRQRLLLPTSRLVKRALDLCLVCAGGVLVLPLVGLIAALVKITSPGPVFYGQMRRGRGGGPFIAWKFRSMWANANEVLEQCLDSDPGLRQEWREFQKLRSDPRITPLGRFLRRTSLDELPQIWNILLGEMSFVGPRPILTEEIPRYGDGFALYEKVTPGLSGLWQVSGRNNVSYEERVGFDLYYVRNWSIWLDLYILARTVKVVVRGDGAY
jgi:Undecaprenyl-phosphate galactose phosphotransferase WbaP